MVCALLLLALLVGGAPPGEGAAAASRERTVVVDDFEDVSAWSAHPAEGVEMALRADAGVHGRALRLDLRFARGTGYGVARRAVSLDLPAHYKFTFRLRGELPPNNLEFKLVDSTGQNVWWHVRRDFAFPHEWETITTRERQIAFAWGPQGGGEIHHVAAIELAVSTGTGGAGTVWIDDLELHPLFPDSAPPMPRVATSSARPGHGGACVLDGDAATSWWSAAGDGAPWLQLDLGREREFGGLVVDWAAGRAASDYAVESSEDGRAWRLAHEVHGGNGGRDRIYLPESEARFVRLRALGPLPAGGVAVRALRLMPLEWSASPEAFLRAVAREEPRGSFPRAVWGEQCYWTVVGADAGREEVLLSEDGMLETRKRGCSVEPFLAVGGRLVTWADVVTEQWLERDQLPLPSVRWRHAQVELTVTAFASGDTGSAVAYARYLVRNLGARPLRATLYLALRPFQVNPAWQSIGMQGGAAPVREIAREGRLVRVNGEVALASLTPPSGFGASSFDQGDIVEHLRAGRLPPRPAARDTLAMASGALAYRLDLAARSVGEVDLLVPLHGRPEAPAGWGAAEARREVQAAEEACVRGWDEHARRVELELPGTAADVAHTVKAQLAYILVNRDGGAIQPGSRNYDRSWMRDGSLTSTALLRLGHPEVVREFIEWFAPFQYANGKIPCCASERGPDPVTENDSHGQFVYLVAEYYRYTGDRALVERVWPHVVKAVDHLDSLRAERRTAEWRRPENARFFGLLLPSISHEGYANPMHSYWDDFFALRGYKDAVYLAGVLGRDAERARFAASLAEFSHDLAASVRATMTFHHVDYVPGCAEYGDFDATSTTVALAPTAAADLLPAEAVRRTFERYWEFFRDRRDGKLEWDAFTPYEVRAIGTFVRLGWRERAAEALDFFMAHRHPVGWRQWAEVEHRDPRAPQYLGDLPHTWVGSDFVRSMLDMLAYERERDSSLVLGAGVPLAWTTEAPGVRVRGLGTPYGALAFSLRAAGQDTEVAIEGGLRVPPGGIVVIPPAARPYRAATVDGAPAPLTAEGAVVVRTLPARVRFSP